ncbi:hypothetical protein BEN47_06205 [Hymenobacter lapidarius]|uniref:IPT/TIG domain-containing protein n=1 Tax=Hymenobacter lapidarius TaxID=1908237 RepID=A0A1G1SQF3_9BACT|nr:IPT/TIG domain-containing protein [Hymenobacter lapidarius]OGX80847.1 hypothetical protein BEN47_06205 [Hymenobacter lapidarius]
MLLPAPQTRAELESLLRALITDPLNNQNTADRVRAIIRAVFEASYNRADDDLPAAMAPLAANELNAGRQSYVNLTVRAALLKLLNEVATAPAAPTNPQTDDQGNIFSGLLVPGFPTISDYFAFGVPGTTGIVDAAGVGDVANGRLYLRNITGERLPGSVGFGVKASGNRPQGAALTNAVAFTGPAAAPAPTGPTLSSFSPTSGAVGAGVTIAGSGFLNTNDVYFNGTPANFTVLSATTINATVPAGATTGKISVATTEGSITSLGNFTLTTSLPDGGTSGTSTTLGNAQYWNNSQNIGRTGYTVRSPYSFFRLKLPSEVASFEVQVFNNLPAAANFSLLQNFGVRVNGAYAQTIEVAPNATAWYPVTVPAGATVDVLNGFLEKAPGNDYQGVFVLDVRLASGTLSFVNPVAPAKRILMYGDSILTGATASPPARNAAAQLVRAELLGQGYDVTMESYSARSVADDYAETADRPGFIAKLGAARDGTAGNLLLLEMGTNDIANISAFQQRAGALIDAYHSAYPADRVLYQLPTTRYDGGGDSAALQQAVQQLAEIRSWLQVFDTNVVQADTISDNLHLTTAGHRKVADAMKVAILNPAAATTPATTILSARDRNNANQLTPAGAWVADEGTGYVSSNGFASQNSSARDNWTMLNAVGFDYNSVVVPNASGVQFLYRTAGSTAAFQLLGTGTQIAGQKGTATIFRSRGLPRGDYEVYMTWDGQGTFNGLLADQVVIYHDAPAPPVSADPLTPLQCELTPAGTWFADTGAPYYSGTGYYSTDLAAKVAFTLNGIIGFDYNCIQAPSGSGVSFFYRVAGSGAAWQPLGTGTQYASAVQAATIFSASGLPLGNYEFYMALTTPTTNGLLADQVVPLPG